MTKSNVARAPVTALLTQLPSVDRLLIAEGAKVLLEQYGRQELLKGIRHHLDSTRQAILNGSVQTLDADDVLLSRIEQYLHGRSKPNLLQVMNLSGTVLHTNLGRAVMPPEVVEAMVAAATEPCALEYDLGQGKRGDRDEIVEDLLCELTGAEAATVVNNNAAAVFYSFKLYRIEKKRLSREEN